MRELKFEEITLEQKNGHLLRKTIKDVTGAFGRIALDLPVFDEEKME